MSTLRILLKEMATLVAEGLRAELTSAPRRAGHPVYAIAILVGAAILALGGTTLLMVALFFGLLPALGIVTSAVITAGAVFFLATILACLGILLSR